MPWKPIAPGATVSTTASHPARLLPHDRRWAGLQLSPNWAGYVATGGSFTSITGRWTVPAVQSPPPTGASGTWLGLDGFSNGSVIQTGTAQNVTSGRTSYYAWYELFPQPPVTLGLVAPGDVIQASISLMSPGTWSISLADVTSGQSASGPVSYSGPGTSAEWIEEAPTDGRTNGVAALANFGTARFSNVAANGSVPSPSVLTALAITDQSSNLLASPSAFDSQQAAFTVSYSGAAVTPPSTTSTTAPPVTNPPAATPAATTCPAAADHPTGGLVSAIAATTTPSGCAGYWVATAQGTVTAFGGAPFLGDLSGTSHPPVVAVASTPSGAGYWLVSSDGAVHGFGDAGTFGDMSGHRLNGSIIAMAPAPDGKGYWLVGSDGGIFTFGSAQFSGSTGSSKLNKPVVGIAPSGDGRSYWLVASDGGIFAFGAAPFLGSMGGIPLNQPVVGMTSDPRGRGYRMVASDGGIFSFGAPFFGSLGGNPPAAPIRAMAPSTSGNGYYMLGSDGAVYAFGDAPHLGNG
jgi:hypothetical protein